MGRRLLCVIVLLWASVAHGQQCYLDDDGSGAAGFGPLPFDSVTSFPDPCDPGFCVAGIVEGTTNEYDCQPCSSSVSATPTAPAATLTPTPTPTLELCPLVDACVTATAPPSLTPTPQLTAAAAPVACRTVNTAVGWLGGIFKDNPAECLPTPAPTATVTSTAAVATPTYTVPFITPTPQLTAAAAPCTCRTVTTAVGVLGGMLADNPCACIATPAPTATSTATTTSAPTPTCFTFQNADGFFQVHCPALFDRVVYIDATPSPSPTATGTATATAVATMTAATATATPTGTLTPTSPTPTTTPELVVAGRAWLTDGLTIGTSDPGTQNNTFTVIRNGDTINTGTLHMGQTLLSLGPTIGTSATTYRSLLSTARTEVRDRKRYTGSIIGVAGTGAHFGDGEVATLVGVAAQTFNGSIIVGSPNSSGAVTTALRGMQIDASTNTTSPTFLPHLSAASIDGENFAGNVTDLISVFGTIGTRSASSLSTNAYGAKIGCLGFNNVSRCTAGTITNATMVQVGDWLSGPTYTNRPLGLHLVKQTATSAVSYKNDGRTVETPDTAQNITAVGNTIAIDTTTHLLTADASYTLTSTPTLANGEDGQRVLILNVDTTDVITIQDQGTLANSNLRLGANTRALGPRDSIMLMYSSTIGDWVEIAFTNVL